MKNSKGQALVEFVVIAPIFIMMITSVIDLSNIIYKKYQLESDLDYIVDLYQENKSDDIYVYASKEDFKTNIANNGAITTIEIYKSVNLYTPILNLIMDNPYKIIVDRVIYSE